MGQQYSPHTERPHRLLRRWQKDEGNRKSSVVGGADIAVDIVIARDARGNGRLEITEKATVQEGANVVGYVSCSCSCTASLRQLSVRVRRCCRYVGTSVDAGSMKWRHKR